jgi:drug/metabolite transporter (DMT)-like permease
MAEWIVYSLVIGANLCFSSSTLVYAHYSKKISVEWMNSFKALFATTGFLILSYFLFDLTVVDQKSYLLLFISGLFGLCLADMLMLKAFTILGASRTLVLFSFQPIILGIAGYTLFGQSLSLNRLVAVLFMLVSLIVFLTERKNETGKWSLAGFVEAFFAVSLDAIGVILTRMAFEHVPQMHPIVGNFYRGTGALFGFLIVHLFFIRINVFKNFIQLNPKDKKFVLLGSFGGTFLSLILYLSALKYAHLASISALSITGPIFAASLECLIHKKKPSLYLMIAFFFFILGVIALSW